MESPFMGQQGYIFRRRTRGASAKQAVLYDIL
jgi:hypothetical protein